MAATSHEIRSVTDPEAAALSTELSRCEVLKSKQPGYLGIMFKRRDTGQLFRLRPIRCPSQPRFWCFEVCRCLHHDEVDPRELPWISSEPLRREDLPAALESVRADIDGWLAEPGQRSMRNWILGEESAAA
jgi:hypothetical protein